MLIIGLGNPGREYENTRHNAGFMVVEALAEKYGAHFEKWPRAKAEHCEIEIGGRRVRLLKPLSFMNLSGGPARAYADFFKFESGKVVIIFDDLSLPLGVLRLRAQGRAGGHNGMQNILDNFGGKDIMRLRVGIGPRPSYFEGKDFVLSKFAAQEAKLLPDILTRAVKGLEDLIQIGFDAAASDINKTEV